MSVARTPRAAYSRRMSKALLCGVMMCLVGGCGTSMKENVHAQFAKDFQCPADKVKVDDTGGGGAFRVTGCGQEAIYSCASSLQGSNLTVSEDVPCVREASMK